MMWGRILKAFSVQRNWNRLTVIHSNPDIERLKGIQGLRFYAMLLVVSAHTIYILFDSLPVSNTKEIEKVSKLKLFQNDKCLQYISVLIFTLL